VIGAVIIAVNVIGLVTAIALAVPRLRAHRTAFWIPLVVGVVCLVLTTGLLVGAAAADPAFTAQLSKP
jgi:type III secretory pathway component EscS